MSDLDTLIREADPARDVVVPLGDEAGARRRPHRGVRSRRSLETVAIGVAVAIAIGVAAVALTAAHDRRRVHSTSPSAVPAAARPLVRILGVLRRPQSAADRAAASRIVRGAPERGLVRLAGVTPWGAHVILVPERGRPNDTLDLDLVTQGGLGSGSGGLTAGPIEAHGLDLLEGPGTDSRWHGVRLVMVVPDGVAKVAFVLSRPRSQRSFSAWRTAPALAVPVHNNVAFVHLNRFCCGMPVTRWYAANGHLIKVTGASDMGSRPPANQDVRRLLEGNGIGTITFGQTRSTVVAQLERLLGPPHETIPGICGFGRSTDWIGLNNSIHNVSSAELNLQFKHDRFVGYAYYANATGPAPQRHGILLATARGLTIGDTVSRARQLYGPAFTQTLAPQGTPLSAKLPRLPIGHISTESGEISAYIQGFGRHDRVTGQSLLESIGAGAGPNTPCR